MNDRALIALLPALALLNACSTGRPTKDDHSITRTPVSGEIAGRPTFSMPIPVPGHSTCIIPYALEERKGISQDPDPYTRARLARASAASIADPWKGGFHHGGVRWHNAVVRDMRTAEEWTILEQRGIISQWHALGPSPKQDQPFKSAALLFIATTADTNRDGVLDDLDANHAISAAGDGRNPRPISPPNAQVWGTLYDEHSGLIYLYIVTDTSGDGAFTTDDAGTPYVLDPRSTEPAKPVLSDQIRQRVESLLR